MQLFLPPLKSMLLVSSIPNIVSCMCLRVCLALCSAQAAISQTAQKDKEAAEKAATKKISLLEKHAAGKRSSQAGVIHVLNYPLSLPRAQPKQLSRRQQLRKTRRPPRRQPQESYPCCGRRWTMVRLQDLNYKVWLLTISVIRGCEAQARRREAGRLYQGHTDIADRI